MSSGNAFDQVKAILGKLDRSIDAARAERLGDTPADRAEPTDDPTNGPSNGPTNGHFNADAKTSERRERPEAARPRPTAPSGDLPRPPGASPTTSNPQRRPGIGRAKPLARPADPRPSDD